MLDPDDVAAPDMVIGCLKLWVQAYALPDQQDFWDGNWLDVVARCEASGAVVEARGTILRNTELRAFLGECRGIYKTLNGQACLKSMEPNLQVRLVVSGLGHVSVDIAITPDHMNQRHEFKVKMDQTYLPGIHRDLERILQRFPVRGEPARS